MDNLRDVKDLRIALTIPTGRPNMRKVVSAFLKNAQEHGYDLQNFSVYLSIDLEYQGTEKSDFLLDSWVETAARKVEYIYLGDREELSERFCENLGIETGTSLAKLFAGRGYSRLRNSALLLAMQDGNDVAICIDDDEAPYIPVKKNDEITWRNLDFFTPHIEAITNGADVTRGPYMGYISPIPSDFEKDIPEEIRIKLGEALALGNEVIAKHSFLNLMNKIRYLSDEGIANSKRPFEVEHGRNGKQILAGNMGINLHSFRKGNIPLFYTPEGARGEDAIFALQLEKLTVVEVNSFIFHDPFGMYTEIFEGIFPKQLSNIPVTLQTKNRFYEALVGWLRYAPILIFMTSKNAVEREQKITEMLKKIAPPTEELARVLNCPEMEGCKKVLKEYVDEVQSHFEELGNAQKVWKEVVSSCVNQPLEVSHAA